MGLVLQHPHVRNDDDLGIIWPHLKTITIGYPVLYGTICDFINNQKEMGHPLETVNVWSHIRQQMEVLKLEYVTESKFHAGLESAIDKVEYEEYDYNADNLTGEDLDLYDDLLAIRHTIISKF